MTAISATEVRGNFSEILGRVAYGKERVTIERRGRPLAVLLPIEDLVRIEASVGGGPAGASNILSSVADNIPGTVYQRVRYPDGSEEYSYVSPGSYDAFGIEPEAMISDPATFSQAIHPEDRERRARAIAESARKLSTYDVQYRLRTPAGETKWLHAIAQPERRADGAIAWTGIVLDITKWKETEAALGESEARYRDIVENVGDLIQSIGPDGNYLFVNQAWKDVLGYSDAEARAISFAEVVHPDDLAHCGEIFEGLERSQNFENVSVVFVARDGREIAVEGHLSSVLEAGKIVHTRAVFRDVTERRKTEAALRESEALLRDLIEGSIEGILIHRDHKPLLVNEAWAAIHGYTLEEIFKIDSVVDLIDPADRERLLGYRDARLRGEAAPERYEYRALRQDGSEIWLEHLVRVVDWGGAPATQTVVIDINERKAAEAALERARDELEQRVEERTGELHATNRALEEEVGIRNEVEERLRESERDLRNLIEGSVQGVLIVTEDRTPRFANQAYAEIYGYDSPAEILALDSTLGLLAPYEVARLDELRKPHFADQEAPISYEFDGIRKDGATIRLQCMAQAMTWRVSGWLRSPSTTSPSASAPNGRCAKARNVIANSSTNRRSEFGWRTGRQ